ncbi:hypothetical protein T4A_14094 [Trichinella pseudospiralis]|uniref:Uncharacterized protein n=1 Tax=Trichinella pseudospiralis TaxID=6337 RepID=A0A0V1DKG1_TRIPS|nr:hypothetical protein T4A_6590 [Trichinella pseudospiralis]KRY62085.1 hypothetical protein T4A_14094 [Trichinella pseudospiralis]
MKRFFEIQERWKLATSFKDREGAQKKWPLKK